MKKIGLVGGLGPAATIDYYQGLVDICRNNISSDFYPEIVIDSVNMTRVINYIAEEKWDEAAGCMTESVANLKAAGADFAAITANTPHIVWDKMKETFEIPVISILDATVDEILKRGYKSVLILGTYFTMKNGLFEKCFVERGIKPVTLSEEDKQAIGNIIYPNLENGIIIMEDKAKMISIAEKYIKEFDVDAVLLGCTEIPLMIKPGDVSKPILNTTQIHINAIFEMARE